MRGSIDGLESSAPIGGMLPAVFADDDLALRFVAGLDEVVAPILLALDCLHTYFDPALAPADFARWLGTWVGAEVDGTEPDARLRAAVAAAYLHRVRGTRRGLSEAVRLAFGVEPEITEAAPPPGTRVRSARSRRPPPRLHVTLRLPEPTPADEYRLENLVAAARPAHMPYTVQVTAAERIPEK
ncbi:phage tail protein [Streptomyces mirabilis]|nr:phage tail protein [Streptomyces mirabilis]